MTSRPPMHQRAASSESVSSTASGHRMVLDHILTDSGTHELPLRTMYSLNLTPRAQPLSTLRPGSSMASNDNSPISPPVSPISPTFQLKNDQAAQQLSSSLMAEISQMSAHQNSLPPAFVSTFLRKCFAYELELVDFPQALTGLDYLKDLESRRRREMKAAFDRLEISPENLDTAEDQLTERYPGVLGWYRSIDDNEHKVTALYTQLYVALRRWILLNELQLLPFSKHNCVAMLNTVYPPIVTNQPTPALTPAVLKSQRDGFFKYIQAVEKKGCSVLKTLMEQGKRQDEANGWPAVRETLEKYLVAANSMIDECSEVVHIQDPARAHSSPGKRGGRKVDSGISFVDSRKSSTASNTSDKSVEEQLRPQTRPQTITRYKSSSTLEKLAREFKHITRSKAEVSEIIQPASQQQTSTLDTPPKGLRKMKSFGSLNLRRMSSRNGSLIARTGSVTPAFDVDEMKRQRLLYESRAESTSPMAAAH